jgi:hypothetical protein
MTRVTSHLWEVKPCFRFKRLRSRIGTGLVEHTMYEVLITVFVALAVIGAATWHRKRWQARHAADPKPAAALIAAVSPGTGELIPTGAEAVSDTGIGDGTPPESPYAG